MFTIYQSPALHYVVPCLPKQVKKTSARPPFCKFTLHEKKKIFTKDACVSKIYFHK